MSFLNARDTIQSNKGRAIANIDGRVVTLFYATKVEIKDTIKTIETPTLDQIQMQYKASTVSTGGSLEYYDVTSEFATIVETYVATGIYPDISLVVTSDDPESKAGSKTTRVDNVIFTETLRAMLDVAGESTKGTTAFVSGGAKDLKKYNKFS